MRKYSDQEIELRGVWQGIRTRCNNPNARQYKHYGGRGIECKFSGLSEFAKCIGPRPSPKHSVDRIDNDGHYEPGNVRWATIREQASNTRKNIVVSYLGCDYTMSELAQVLGCEWTTLRNRLKRGWSIEDIIYKLERKRERQRRGPMNTCADLIKAWGTMKQMADDMGTTYGVVASWKQRNAIPYEVFPQIVVRAPMRGLQGITYELLHSLQRGVIEQEKSTKPKKNGRRRERTTA